MQVQLLVWIFVMRIMMIIASAAVLLHQRGHRQGRFGNAKKMNFERR